MGPEADAVQPALALACRNGSAPERGETPLRLAGIAARLESCQLGRDSGQTHLLRSQENRADGQHDHCEECWHRHDELSCRRAPIGTPQRGDDLTRPS